MGYCEYRGKQGLFYRQAPEVLKGLREVAVIESSESSNRLEGVTVAANRLKALVVQGTAPRDRSEQEVAGYRDALSLIHESSLLVSEPLGPGSGPFLFSPQTPIPSQVCSCAPPPRGQAPDAMLVGLVLAGASARPIFRRMLY